MNFQNNTHSPSAERFTLGADNNGRPHNDDWNSIVIFTANLLGECLRVGVSVGTELGIVLHEAFECDGGHVLGNFDSLTPFALGW